MTNKCILKSLARAHVCSYLLASSEILSPSVIPWEGWGTAGHVCQWTVLWVFLSPWHIQCLSLYWVLAANSPKSGVRASGGAWICSRAWKRGSLCLGACWCPGIPVVASAERRTGLYEADACCNERPSQGHCCLMYKNNTYICSFTYDLLKWKEEKVNPADLEVHDTVNSREIMSPKWNPSQDLFCALSSAE